MKLPIMKFSAATCHFRFLIIILLYFVIVIKSYVENKLWSSTLCSFLQPHVTSTLFYHHSRWFYYCNNISWRGPITLLLMYFSTVSCHAPFFYLRQEIGLHTPFFSFTSSIWVTYACSDTIHANVCSRNVSYNNHLMWKRWSMERLRISLIVFNSFILLHEWKVNMLVDRDIVVKII
jgi:hypothetical protein